MPPDAHLLVVPVNSPSIQINAISPVLYCPEPMSFCSKCGYVKQLSLSLAHPPYSIGGNPAAKLCPKIFFCFFKYLFSRLRSKFMRRRRIRFPCFFKDLVFFLYTSRIRVCFFFCLKMYLILCQNLPYSYLIPSFIFVKDEF
jgi:hypothetical protein